MCIHPFCDIVNKTYGKQLSLNDFYSKLNKYLLIESLQSLQASIYTINYDDSGMYENINF
jgi:hypothetical protein